MFDEVNEGTQIEKINNKPPVQAAFLTYDGATSDYYLRLVGAGAKLLKENKPISPVIPISPFDLQIAYRIKNKANELMLDNTGKTRQASDAAGTDWQLVFDGNGYFKIKNRQSNKILSANSADSAVSLTADSNADNLKWHLEWDGTGCCRIINKATGKAIGSTAGSDVAQTTDAGLDNLRWQILPQ